MCLIAFALGLRDDCPLLLASNRDEFWARPTLPLDTWTLPTGEMVASGRDLRAGGTWLGFTAKGRVAMLTNVRNGEPDVAPRSRGELVTQWLAGSTEAPDWEAMVARQCPSDYGGFNLVLGDITGGDWVWLSNRAANECAAGTTLPVSGGWYGLALEPGIYGLSNAGLDTPWPKTRRLKTATLQALEQWPAGDPAQDGGWREPLLAALLDREPADDQELPSTGIPWERERQLSSPFVHLTESGYGTRSSLIAHWRPSLQGGLLELEEWTHANEATASGHWSRWPLDRSIYRRISMSTWGMPTSS